MVDVCWRSTCWGVVGEAVVVDVLDLRHVVWSCSACGLRLFGRLFDFTERRSALAFRFPWEIFIGFLEISEGLFSVERDCQNISVNECGRQSDLMRCRHSSERILESSSESDVVECQIGRNVVHCRTRPHYSPIRPKIAVLPTEFRSSS